MQDEKFNLIREQILNIVFKYLDKDKTIVYLFGSRAEGTNGRFSDIDIGIEFSEGDVPSKEFLSIGEEVNNKVDTLLKIDVVDFNRLNNEFKNFALKEAIIWHSPKNMLKD